MIIFYTLNYEDVILTGILKYYIPTALIREYSQNENIIQIAKIHNEKNFIKIKEYKLAILNRYKFPSWIKNDKKLKFYELLLNSNNIKSEEIITHIAKYLFNPEELFHGYNDKTILFKKEVKKVINELIILQNKDKNHKNNRKIKLISNTMATKICEF